MCISLFSIKQAGRLYGLLLGLIFPVITQAGMIIESQEAERGSSRVSIDSDWARIDNSDWDIYILINLSDNHVYAISPQEQQIVDLSTPAPTPSAHAQEAIAKVGQPEAILDKLGPGPKIAGFPTTRYQVSVNNNRCYQEYLATQPLQNPLIQRFVQALAQASTTEADAALEIAINPERICQLADNLVDDQYPTLGIPMLTTDAKNNEAHRITSIRPHADFSQHFFSLPKGYRILSRQEVQQQLRAHLDPDAPEVNAREKAIEQLIQNHRQSQTEPLPSARTLPAEQP